MISAMLQFAQSSASACQMSKKKKILPLVMADI